MSDTKMIHIIGRNKRSNEQIDMGVICLDEKNNITMTIHDNTEVIKTVDHQVHMFDIMKLIEIRLSDNGIVYNPYGEFEYARKQTHYREFTLSNSEDVIGACTIMELFTDVQAMLERTGPGTFEDYQRYLHHLLISHILGYQYGCPKNNRHAEYINYCELIDVFTHQKSIIKGLLVAVIILSIGIMVAGSVFVLPLLL